jgi:hypothetical protein
VRGDGHAANLTTLAGEAGLPQPMRTRRRHAFGTLTVTGFLLARITIPAFRQYGKGENSGTCTTPGRAAGGAETTPRTTR